VDLCRDLRDGMSSRLLSLEVEFRIFGRGEGWSGLMSPRRRNCISFVSGKEVGVPDCGSYSGNSVLWGDKGFVDRGAGEVTCWSSMFYSDCID